MWQLLKVGDPVAKGASGLITPDPKNREISGCCGRLYRLIEVFYGPVKGPVWWTVARFFLCVRHTAYVMCGAFSGVPVFLSSQTH